MITSLFHDQHAAAGADSIETSLSAAPVVPPLCPPFAQQANGTFAPTSDKECALLTPPHAPISNIQTEYAPYVCGSNDTVYVADNEEQSRRNCMAVGKPLQESDYVTIVNQATAIGVRTCRCTCRASAPVSVAGQVVCKLFGFACLLTQPDFGALLLQMLNHILIWFTPSHDGRVSKPPLRFCSLRTPDLQTYAPITADKHATRLE